MTRGERGAVTVEFVLLLPVLMILVGVVVAGARVWWSRAAVEQLAASAARQASIARTDSDARAGADQLVRQDAARTGLHCLGGRPRLTLDTTGFRVPVGQTARVHARVTCEVPLSDVILPFVGGSLRVEAQATSTLDRFRARR